MEIRAYCLQLLEADTLEGKLRPPPADLTDEQPGPALRIRGPIRPATLRHDPLRKVKVPPLSGMADPEQRARIIHSLANHELQAAELFAWALLLFPDMPASFRQGCVGILREEQEHCGLYIERLRKREVTVSPIRQINQSPRCIFYLATISVHRIRIFHINIDYIDTTFFVEIKLRLSQ